MKLASVEMNVHSWQGLVAGTCGHQTRHLDQRSAQNPKCIVLLAKMSLQDFTTSSGQKDLHALVIHACFGSRVEPDTDLSYSYIWGFWYTSLLPLQKAKKGDCGPALKQVSKEKRCELDGAVRG